MYEGNEGKMLYTSTIFILSHKALAIQDLAGVQGVYQQVFIFLDYVPLVHLLSDLFASGQGIP